MSTTLQEHREVPEVNPVTRIQVQALCAYSMLSPLMWKGYGGYSCDQMRHRYEQWELRLTGERGKTM